MTSLTIVSRSALKTSDTVVDDVTAPVPVVERRELLPLEPLAVLLLPPPVVVVVVLPPRTLPVAVIYSKQTRA